MKPHVVLALDLAGCTGYAIGGPEKKPIIGSMKVSREDDARSFSALRAMIIKLATEHGATAIAYESPIRKTEKSTFATIVRLHGYCAIAGCCGVDLGLALGDVAVQSARKAFLGKNPPAGKGKIHVADYARILGFHGYDHNATDALAVWWWAQAVHWPRAPIKIDRQRNMDFL